MPRICLLDQNPIDVPDMQTRFEFDNLFPYGEMINVVSGNKVPRFYRLWNYSNRILMDILDTRRDNQSNVIEVLHCWVSFNMIDDEHVEYITHSNDRSEVIAKSLNVWNPPLPQIIVDNQEIALDMIENNILAVMKRNKLSELKKSSCAYIFFNEGSWHAYYPEVSVLSEFHKKQAEQNIQYLEFLNSQEFAEMREKWDLVSPDIIPGE